MIKEDIQVALTTDHIFPHCLEFLSEIQQNDSYDTLKCHGFLPKNRKKEPWTKQETDKLLVAMHDIASGKILPHVQDISYYISHYIFDDFKSSKEITYKINQLIREKIDK